MIEALPEHIVELETLAMATVGEALTTMVFVCVALQVGLTPTV